MPIAPHLTRRGAVYYWRRRLPPRLAAFQNRKHVLMTLLTASPLNPDIVVMKPAKDLA
jgi:hypothetical protein